MNHDPKVTTERLEAEGFEVRRQNAGGYRLEGTVVDNEGNAIILLPDAEALYWWWHGWWFGRHHERAIRTVPESRPVARGYPADKRRRQERERWKRTSAARSVGASPR